MVWIVSMKLFDQKNPQLFFLKKKKKSYSILIKCIILGNFKILYVTPERLAKSKRFMTSLQKCYLAKRLSLIAIDEGMSFGTCSHDVPECLPFFCSSLHQSVWK